MLAISSLAGVGDAFVVLQPPLQQHQRQSSSCLAVKSSSPSSKDAFQRVGATVVAGAVMGWTLFTSTSMASPLLPLNAPSLVSVSSSVMVAKGAYLPESGFDSLDFNMPSYTVKNEIAPKPDNIDTRPERPVRERSASNKPAKEAKVPKVKAETPLKPSPPSKAEKAKAAAAQLAALQEKREKEAEQKAINIAEVQAQRQAIAEKAAAAKAQK